MAGAHKKFYRIQHPEIYLLDLKAQYKHKIELPLDMVTKHVFELGIIWLERLGAWLKRLEAWLERLGAGAWHYKARSLARKARSWSLTS